LSFRLEKLEQDHTALLAEVHDKLSELHPPQAAKPVETPSFEAPPFIEPPHAFEGEVQQDARDDAPHDVSWPPASHPAEDHHDLEAIDAFAPMTAEGFAPDSHQEPHAESDLDDFADDLSDVFADQEPDNFLAQARRSAQSRFRAGRWRKSGAPLQLSVEPGSGRKRREGQASLLDSIDRRVAGGAGGSGGIDLEPTRQGAATRACGFRPAGSDFLRAAATESQRQPNGARPRRPDE